MFCKNARFCFQSLQIRVFLSNKCWFQVLSAFSLPSVADSIASQEARDHFDFMESEIMKHVESLQQEVEEKKLKLKKILNKKIDF